MRRLELLLLAIVAALALTVVLMRRQVLKERLARFNAAAAADSSRLVDSVARVSERLAFQDERIQLRGDLGRVLRAKNEQTQLLARVQVRLDSIAGAVTAGVVTSGADTAIRQLAAELDTAGYHVRINAAVPAPPAAARVTWFVRRDPVAIVAALNRTPDGQAALRVMTGPHAMARIDTVRVQTAAELQKTSTLGKALLLILGGYIAGRLLR